ncbi:long-chain fatty acid--CoA ligase [Phenylobacterium sp.]|uniref:AMP-dependent synthetase/ligase n=1 Tax=Phenylobacterium sp. TaxID=1871053 RepID=UPI0035B42ED5
MNMPSEAPGTVRDLILARAREAPDFEAFVDLGRNIEDPETWRSFTWAEIVGQAQALAARLQSAGLQPGDRICILAGVRVEHVVADYAAQLMGGVSISLYETFSDDQLRAVLAIAAPQAFLCETHDQLRRLHSLATAPVTIALVMDDDAWTSACGRSGEQCDAPEITADSPSTILFTSGTTGQPKGVVLSHGNLTHGALATAQVPGLYPDPDLYLAYLPLAHIAERGWSFYAPLATPRTVFLLRDMAWLPAAMKHVRPTFFFGTPRVWEKLAESLLAALRDPAVAAPLRPVVDRTERRVANGVEPVATDIRALAPLRTAIGLDRCAARACGAARLDPRVGRFFAALGLGVTEGYGLSETAGVATVGEPGKASLGAVGRPIPGVELRFALDGEVLVRGPTLTPGYFRDPGATEALFDAEGWLRTGDLGALAADGQLLITGRKKELIITASGKNIPPEPIESEIKNHPYVEHALLIGEGRPFLTALIVLSDAAGAVSLDGAAEALQDHVHRINLRLARIEQVKRFEIVVGAWSVKGGELTPTLKLRRSVIADRHAAIIERLYGEHVA